MCCTATTPVLLALRYCYAPVASSLSATGTHPVLWHGLQIQRLLLVAALASGWKEVLQTGAASKTLPASLPGAAGQQACKHGRSHVIDMHVRNAGLRRGSRGAGTAARLPAMQPAIRGALTTAALLGCRCMPALNP